MPEPEATPTVEPAAPATASGEPTAPPADAQPTEQPTTPTVPEGGQPAEGKKDWTVPGERLQDETRKRQEAEKLAEERQAELDTLRSAASTPTDDDPEEAAAQKWLDEQLDKKLAAKGVVTTSQIELQNQIDKDVIEITGWAKEKGYPEFDRAAVVEYAKEHKITINGKEGLRSAYLDMSIDKIEENARKNGVADGAAPTPQAEAPSGGAAVPADGDKPKTSKERILARITEAQAAKQ